MSDSAKRSIPSQDAASVPEGSQRAQLEQRLELLTREILQLKSLLRAEPEPLPDTDYDALTVEIAAEQYAIPVAVITEVVELVWPDPLPDTPAWILGSIHYADEQVPIVDVRQRLLGEATAWSLSTKLVLVEHGALRALVVDSAGDLVRVAVERVTRPPADIPQSPFLLGSLRPEEGRTLHLLSLERISREFAAAN
ncbi:MAG: chemotaxis protein CheW [Enhygromyxa sp.]